MLRSIWKKKIIHFFLYIYAQVDALCLINCSSTAAGWIEWGYQLMNSRNLRSKGMTQSVEDYLMWHHFGRNPEERNLDLVQVRHLHCFFNRFFSFILTFKTSLLCTII